MDQLAVPSFLIAMPQLLDPNFFRSVILLLAHSDEGAFGLVVNHPSDIKVAAVCAEAEIGWLGGPDSPAFSGGPVERERGWLLHSDEDSYEGSQRIMPGLALSASQEALTAYGKSPEGRFRLLLGYAGWGAGQLDRELREGSWLTAPAEPELVFDTPPGKAWSRALQNQGIDPTNLVEGGSLLN